MHSSRRARFCGAAPGRTDHTCRLERETRSLAHDGAEAREIHVGAGDREAVGRDTVEHALAGRAGHLRIDVVDETGVGPRNLDRREVDEIAPDQQAVLARLNEPAGVARRMPGHQHRRDARHRLAVGHGAQAAAIGRRWPSGCWRCRGGCDRWERWSRRGRARVAARSRARSARRSDNAGDRRHRPGRWNGRGAGG